MKPIQSETMFVPNYEDYDRPSTNYGAAVFPPLWPEEMAGEGAIYRRYKELSVFYHSLNVEDVIEYFKRILTKDEKVRYLDMVEKTLAWLADQCGWKIKNEYNVEHYDCAPLYVTDRPIEDYKTEPQSDEGIIIDMKALANHICELMPVMFSMRNEIKKFGKPESRMELQELVCTLMAKENNWQEFSNGKYRIV